jgi:hypothetical protein
VLIYKHSLSIRSEFVGLVDGEMPKNYDKGLTSYDYVDSYFVELTLTEDKRKMAAT